MTFVRRMAATVVAGAAALLAIPILAADPAPPDLDALLQHLARPAPATTPFVEVHFSPLLSRPLIGNPAGSEEDGGGFDLRHTLGEAASRADIAYLTDQPATLVALVRSAFGVGVINRLALQTTSTEGLTIRTIDSPSAHREVALHWTRRRADSAVVKAFLDAQQQVPLPVGVQPIRDQSTRPVP